MKSFVLIILLLPALLAGAQQKKDTIIINDSWQKKDTITPRNSTLKDSLPAGNEMKIIKSTPASSDQTKTINNPGNNNNSNFELNILGKKGYRKSGNSSEGRSRKKFSGHWFGFYYGFTNFTNPEYPGYAPGTKDFMELNWAQSFTMQFNLLEQSINLVPGNNFGLVTGVGFEYKRLRFENNHVTIEKNDDGMIVPLELDNLGITHVKRNSFKILYLTIPLLMEYQFPASSGQRLHISAGVMGGVRLHSKTKVVYNNTEGKKRKRKDTDSYNMIPFKADAMAQIGYKHINIWGTYSLTNMFKADKGPELRQYTVGVGFNF